LSFNGKKVQKRAAAYGLGAELRARGGGIEEKKSESGRKVLALEEPIRNPAFVFIDWEKEKKSPGTARKAGGSYHSQDIVENGNHKLSEHLAFSRRTASSWHWGGGGASGRERN